MVVVDEFTALLKDHPEFKDVFEHLARQGLRSHPLGAGDPVTDRGVARTLDSNLGWRVALKTATARNSMAAISGPGTPTT